jgi:transposase
MRKSFAGLQGLVARELEEDPLSGTLYVFVNRRRNLVKALFWDRTGYVLVAKRLERGRFSFPSEDRVQDLSRQIFLLFLERPARTTTREGTTSPPNSGFSSSPVTVAKVGPEKDP